jgi:2',3'-cyclic-nucleotide 2'-phosphodiesterase (5'-nucleotidase family)
VDDAGKIETVGGYARIAAAVKKERERWGEKSLLVDAGDFAEGSLFHTVLPEEALEFRLMGKMGYDGITVGNHDFDFHPLGLAKMLDNVRQKGYPAPPLVVSNLLFSAAGKGDAELKAAFGAYPVRDTLVVEKNGLRIGLFGIMGRDAAEDTPYATPATFSDPVEAARRAVDLLKNREKVDLVVCLSHSGTWPVRSHSEDEILADKVPEIDVIISGHTHTTLPKPIVSGKTIIVSAGAYASNLGVLALKVEKGKAAAVAGYELVKMTPQNPEDPEIARDVESFKRIVEARYLSHYGYRFDQAVAESAFDLEPLEWCYARPGEIGLGNLVTDAYRDAVKKAEGPAYRHVAVGVTVLGNIRSSLAKGKIGVADVFQVLSMGPPVNGYSGNTLVAGWMTGAELKDLLEVHTSIAPFKDDAHLSLSGVRFAFNPRRMIFDRVTEAKVEEADGTFRPLEKGKLYRVVFNSFVVNLLGVVSEKSHGLLKVAIRDGKGNVLKDFGPLVVDGGRPGYELKEWVALAGYLASFPRGASGLPAIPERYRGPEGRIVSLPSWNPISLVAGGGWLTWGAVFLLLVVLLALAATVRFLVRRVRRIGSQPAGKSGQLPFSP